MIAFSIMMFFVSFILCVVSISLLRGNTSSIHGKVFESTDDKTGYAKALGKATLFITVGIAVCGFVALANIVYAILVILTVIFISIFIFIKINNIF